MFKRYVAAALALATSVVMASVDVNKADRAALEGVKGVGPATAERILVEREKGTFSNWADFIVRTPGIGDARAERLSADGLTVNGQTYRDATAPVGSAAAAPSAGTRSAVPGNAAKSGPGKTSTADAR